MSEETKTDRETLLVIEEIKGERFRQKNAEGWTPEHDDEHDDAELASAAAMYANWSRHGSFEQAQRFAAAGIAPAGWPWDATWFKADEPRRMLVKAAALIVAEIERLDRQALSNPSPGKGS